MLKHGLVSDSKPGFARVVFQADDNMVSDWLPVCVPFAFGKKMSWKLKVNTMVACMMDEHCEEGVILGALFNDQDTVPNTANDHNVVIEFEDGSVISYDEETHELKADILGNITARSSGNIDVESIEGDVTAKGATVHVTAPAITLEGAVLIKGVVTVGGMVLQAMAGVTGADGKVAGDINVTGKVLATDDVKAGTVSLKTHIHPVTGSVTGVPNP